MSIERLSKYTYNITVTICVRYYLEAFWDFLAQKYLSQDQFNDDRL